MTVRQRTYAPKNYLVRYSTVLLAHFKSTGEGWQSHMDGALREYVAQHSRGA
jgi:uncharacterized protein (DUF4415 family)